MTDPKEKSKTIVPTREPKKKTQGTFDNLRKLPQAHPVEEILNLPTASTPSTPSRASIAPSRDFSKVANSIARQAVPFGVFGGKSKQLYDFLYSLTRGAITPQRAVVITKVKLMAGADIGSEVTLRKNLDRLKSAGLVNERIVAGVHGGNEYTVNLPEEATPSRPSTPSSSLSFVEPLEALETTPSSTSLNQAQSSTSEVPKTSFKTIEEKTDDDDAPLALLNTKLQAASIKLTGKPSTAADRERWGELADVLVAELKIAAARTTVSNVPAFLAEHLRRRLWKIDKKQAHAEGEELPDDAGAQGVPDVDASKCPDCGGSGWWYPDGEGKGVAKCKHARMA